MKAIRTILLRDFLSYMEQHYDPRALRIPGPLVPFFEGLSASCGPNNQTGNVTFAIPPQLNVSQSSNFMPANQLGYLLPSVILTLDQMIRLLLQAIGNDDVSDSWYTNIFGDAANAATATRFVMLSPNARNQPYVPLSQFKAFNAQSAFWLEIYP